MHTHTRIWFESSDLSTFVMNILTSFSFARSMQSTHRVIIITARALWISIWIDFSISNTRLWWIYSYTNTRVRTTRTVGSNRSTSCCIQPRLIRLRLRWRGITIKTHSLLHFANDDQTILDMLTKKKSLSIERNTVYSYMKTVSFCIL